MSVHYILVEPLPQKFLNRPLQHQFWIQNQFQLHSQLHCVVNPVVSTPKLNSIDVVPKVNTLPSQSATKTTTVTATKTKTVTVTKTQTVPLAFGSKTTAKLTKPGTEKQILREFKDCVTRAASFKEVELLLERAKKINYRLTFTNGD